MWLTQEGRSRVVDLICMEWETPVGAGEACQHRTHGEDPEQVENGDCVEVDEG